MVVVRALVNGSSEYKREAFLSPQHYIKWRECMGKKLVDVKPVRKGGYYR
jgi:hypothetical protein